MGTEQNQKKHPNNIGKYFAGMTEEEKLQWRKESLRKAQETRDRKKVRMEELKKKAEELLPRILAEDLLMIEQESYTPRQETLTKVRELLDDPTMTFDELKRKHFGTMSEKGWAKLTKFLFSNQVANVEDLGNDILQEKRRAIKTLEKRIRMLRKEVKLSREINFEKHKKKIASQGLLEMMGEAEKELREYKLDIQKTLHEVKFAKEGKSGALSLHVHTSVPRPQPKDVTPPKVSLSDVLSHGN